VTIALARRELPIGDSAYEHLTRCSPCYLEVRALQEAEKGLRRQHVLGLVTRTIAAAVVVFVVAVAAWFFINNRRVTDIRTELDLRPYALTRGEPPSAERPPSVDHPLTCRKRGF
jgi:hypothetical protein